jgi:Lantibiotic dehydratase, N terminus
MSSPALAPQYSASRSFVLRTTGFPVDLIERLASPELATAVDEALAAQQGFIAGLHSLESVDGLSRSLRRKLKRGIPIERGTAAGTAAEDLNGLLIQIQELQRQAEDVYEREFGRTRRLLYEFVAEEGFGEVLLWSSPGLSRLTPNGGQPPKNRNSHVRQREFSWISYLQRVTTKNETISFFGPCAWGEIDPSESTAAVVEVGDELISRRVVYLERWVCEQLARLMSADPELKRLLPFQLADDVVIEDDRAVLLMSGRTVTLSQTERAIVERCVAAFHPGEDFPFAEALLERGVLRREIQVPVSPSPFRALRDAVNQWPQHPAKVRWQQALDEIERCRAQIEEARGLENRRNCIEEMEARLAKLGINSRQASQALYASRLPINEDCRLGTRTIKLGKPVIEQLVNDAVPWFDLWRDLAGLYATRLHQYTQEIWESMGAKPVPLPLFWPAIRSVWGRLALIEPEVQQAWRKQLGNRHSERTVQLLPEDTAFLRNDFALRRMKACDNVAPDMQIVATDHRDLADGRWKLLIAEIHPDFVNWQHCFFVWCPDAEAYAKDYGDQDGQGSIAVIGRYGPYFGPAHTALWVYPYAHKWKFVGVPGPEGATTVRSAETLVEVTDDDVLLRHTNGCLLGSLLHTWNTATHTHRLEFRGGFDHSPRLELGRVIVQRESWIVDIDITLRRDVQMGGATAYTALRRLRKEHGLPEQVFVRGWPPQRETFEKDVKPVFVDFRSPLLVEMMAKMMTRFPKLSITEMLPTTDGCWLKGTAGRHSSEFRLVVKASRESRQTLPGAAAPQERYSGE